MLTFQERVHEQRQTREYVERKDFRMVREKECCMTPPESKRDLHAPKRWKSRLFEGGTIEEALPMLELGLMEGCTVFWNGRQFTAADIELQRGVLLLGDKMKELSGSQVRTLGVSAPA